MQAAIADGATLPLLPVVADLSMHNAERHSHRLFKRAYNLNLEPYYVEFELFADDLCTVETCREATFPMHELLYHVWQDPARRMSCLFGPVP